MANRNQTVEALIAEGRLYTESYSISTTPRLIDVNFDALYDRITDLLVPLYVGWDALRDLYHGQSATITTNITRDVGYMVTFALWVLYNRLRTVAEGHYYPARTDRMNTRAPVSPRMEFPSFLSQLLESISWLRITDGPTDYLMLFTAAAGTSNNFGRTGVQVPGNSDYENLIDRLRRCGVQMSPIDMTPNVGSFWPTIKVISEESLYYVLGTFHRSHYVTEDVVKAIFLAPSPRALPFPDLTTTIGLVTDSTVVTAFSALTITGAPAGDSPTSAARPVAGCYNVNYRGIRLASGEDTPAGFYVYGRGSTPVYTCYLARRITQFDVNLILRDRFRH
uniref:Coat protein n=1 Tax=Spinach deltapartitivirus 1 TaxID=1985163 RepID=A0A1W6S3T7_9VIRU|nr:coat protein [Spinach deltapartitivirus 1]